MASINVAVVEDEASCREQTLEYLKRFEKENDIVIHVREYEDGMDVTEDFRGQFDIVFCDIQMKHMSGMKAAEYIRQIDDRVIIIFITNLAEYAIMGYEVAASGYLLKPINYNLFARYLSRAVKSMDCREQEYLIVRESRGIRRFPLSEIRYFSCDGHYINIHMGNETPRIYMSVRELEAMLPERDFAKCNSGTIVNMNYVNSMNGGMVQVEGESISLSRSQKKPFAAKLAEFLSGI